MGHNKLLSFLVLVVGVDVIGTTLFLLLSASGVGHITVVDHNGVVVSNLHCKVMHTEGKRGNSKAMSTRNAMRPLISTVLVTAVTDPLT